MDSQVDSFAENVAKLLTYDEIKEYIPFEDFGSIVYFALHLVEKYEDLFENAEELNDEDGELLEDIYSVLGVLFDYGQDSKNIGKLSSLITNSLIES